MPSVRVLTPTGDVDESPDRALCECGHPRTAHEFTDDARPVVDAVLCTGCDECWDCVTGYRRAV